MKRFFLSPGGRIDLPLTLRPARAIATALMAFAVVGGPQASLAQETPAAQEAGAGIAAPPPAPSAEAEALGKARASAAEMTQAGRHAEAVPFAEEALRLSEKVHGADAAETGVAAHNLGFLLRRAGKIAEAQQSLERALAIYERVNPAVHEDTRNAVGELGQIYVRAGRAADVVGIYQRLIERAGREGYGTHVGVGHMHNNAAFLSRGLSRPEDSESHWQRALAIYEAQASLDEPSYLLALGALIDRRQGAGQGDAARALIAEKLGMLRARGQGEGSIALDLLNRSSKIEHQAGRYAQARDQALAALQIVERGSSPQGLDAVTPLNNLARAERALANYAAAEQLYKRAIAILESKGSPANSGILNDNLAVLYMAMGRFEEAETHHKRALQLLEGALGRDHREVGQVAANFGAMLSNVGRYAEAETFLRRALAIAGAQSPQDLVGIAIVTDNLSGVLRQTSRHGEAIEPLQRALAMFEKALPPGHPTLATARNNLGRLLLELGRHAEAETQLRAALETYEKLYGADHVNVAIPAANLGETYAAMGQPDRGRELLRRALAAQERTFGAKHAMLMDTLIALGRLELASNRPAEAVGIYERAVSVALASRGRFGMRSRPSREQTHAERNALIGLMNALWQSGGRGDLAMLKRALEVGQWTTMTPAAVALAALSARSGAGDPGLAALARERQDAAADWQAADKRLTELLSQTERNEALEKSLRERLDALSVKLAGLDNELQVRFPRYEELSHPAPLGLEETRRLLRPNEAALQYVVTPDAAHVWLISEAQTRWLRLPVGEKDLLAMLRSLRCGLDRAEWIGAGAERCARLLGLPPQVKLGESDPLPFPAEHAHALYAALLAPLEDAIAGKELLIVASGPLAALPFGVLITEKPDAGLTADGAAFARLAWLGRRQALTVLPSLASLKALRELARTSQAATPFLGIGNPLLTGESGEDRRAWSRQSCAPAADARVASAAFAPPTLRSLTSLDILRRQTPLPETADELCGVARFVEAAPETVLLGSEATETRVKSLSATGALANARILHFATHGLLADEAADFLANGAEPSLLLTPPQTANQTDDGLLTASEVAALKLDADWVILSACNTASGDKVGAEALSGLARSFFYAGARSLLVSHWAVDSDTTVRLITGAFAGMGQTSGTGHAEALRKSMTALIAAGGWQAHPAYWAPFVVVGGNGPAPAQTSRLPDPAALPVNAIEASPPLSSMVKSAEADASATAQGANGAGGAATAITDSGTQGATSDLIAAKLAAISPPATPPLPDNAPPLPVKAPNKAAPVKAAANAASSAAGSVIADVEIPPLPVRAPPPPKSAATQKPAQLIKRARKKEAAENTPVPSSEDWLRN